MPTAGPGMPPCVSSLPLPGGQGSFVFLSSPRLGHEKPSCAFRAHFEAEQRDSPAGAGWVVVGFQLCESPGPQVWAPKPRHSALGEATVICPAVSLLESRGACLALALSPASSLPRSSQPSLHWSPRASQQR